MATKEQPIRALILTSGYGDGHNTAARNAAEAIRREQPDAEVVVEDLILSGLPHISKFTQNLYRWIIRNAPNAWAAIYHISSRSERLGSGSAFYRPICKAIRDRVSTFKPDVLISTYPLYGHLVHDLKEKQEISADLPLLTIVTDARSLHPAWADLASARFCVTDPRTAGVLRGRLSGRGRADAEVFATGFPVHPDIDTAPTHDPDDGVPTRILYFAGSSAAPHVRMTLAQIAAAAPPETKITAIMGRAAHRLSGTIENFARNHSHLDVNAIGWTDEVPRLLAEHHIVISKGGGATTHELRQACRPLLINFVVPGQEQGNADLLAEEGGAILATEPGPVTTGLREPFTHPDIWTRRRDAMLKARPHSTSKAIAEKIITLAKS